MSDSPHCGNPNAEDSASRRPPITFVANIISASRLPSRPSGADAGPALPEACLPLLNCTTRDGLHLVVPDGFPNSARDPLSAFFHGCWQFGFDILQRTFPDRFTPEVANSYRTMWFLFQRLHRTRVISSRRFNGAKDFIRDRSGSGNRDGRETILPWPTDCGRTNDLPQTMAELVERGTALAAQLNVTSPTIAQSLHYGLSASARIVGQALPSSDQIKARVQAALLPGLPVIDVQPSAAEAIEERIIAALLKHCDADESQEDYDAWLLGEHNSFVKQIAQQIKHLELPNAREQVNSVLGQLGCQSLYYVAQCAQAVMRDVERRLVEDRIEYDKSGFDLLYYPQECFAHLPLVMLREKLEFFEGTFESLRSKTAGAEAEFSTMLLFYATLISERREVDRELSSSRKALSYEPDRDLPRFDSTDSNESSGSYTQALITDLVTKGRLHCSCSAADWHLVSQDAASTSPSATFRCRCCQQTHSVAPDSDTTQA